MTATPGPTADGFDVDGHATSLSDDDRAILRQAVDLGQAHLFAHWPPPGEADADKARQLAQLRALDAQYPGGLATYVANARDLLAKSRAGDNPYDGFTPVVPTGERLAFASPEFDAAEAAGVAQATRTAFVLVAGGLGERLGYGGIKIALPSETASGTTFIGRYVAHLLALQARANALTGEDRTIPLAIMTSGDTDEPTRALLEANDDFGLAPGQLTVVKQEKVPSLCDNAARFAQDADDPYAIETKPHGHGDVHALLHQSGLATTWLAGGYEHVVFFQDTNGLVFHALPAMIGVSHTEGYQVNSMVVPRTAGEAAGGIVRLESETRTLTINVEYNQLDPLLRASGHPDGDVADDTGYSPYPGNTNVLVMALAPYVDTLARTEGGIPEFVNPKYADAAKETFKKPTRLECMMQDYPKLLPADALVGFTQFERDMCFSTVKNNLADATALAAKGVPAASASTGEAELFALHRKLLRLAGAEVAEGEPQTFAGIELDLFPVVSLSPRTTTPRAEVEERLRGITISDRSCLVIRGDGEVVIDGLDLDGALVIDTVAGATVTVRGLRVRNEGWRAVPAPADAPEEIAIRGFAFERLETEHLRFEEPGDHVVE